MLLTIIIPAYIDTKEKQNALSKVLGQLQFQIMKSKEEIQVILVDDASPLSIPYLKSDCIKQIWEGVNNGVSRTRNIALACTDSAWKYPSTDYISFVDADDEIAPDYIDTIIDAIYKTQADIIKLSWKTLDWNSKQIECIVDDEHPDFPEWNTSIWNYVFRSKLICNIRFDEKLKQGSDAVFLKDVMKEYNYKFGVTAYITKPLYYYNIDVKGSITKRLHAGEFSEDEVYYHKEG